MSCVQDSYPVYASRAIEAFVAKEVSGASFGTYGKSQHMASHALVSSPRRRSRCRSTRCVCVHLYLEFAFKKPSIFDEEG